MHPKRTLILMSVAAAGLLALPAWAQDGERGPSASSMRMTYVPQETRREAQEERQEARQEMREEAREERAETRREMREEDREMNRERNTAGPAGDDDPEIIRGPYQFNGVSSFFNVREANPNVEQGEFEFEFTSGWETESTGGDNGGRRRWWSGRGSNRRDTDDDMWAAQAIRYGVTDDFFVELQVLQPAFGDGGDSGAGDMNLKLFYRFLQETDELPAIAGMAAMRIPSGDGSSGVDGRFDAIITKTLADRFRVNLQGWVQTVNGSSGASDAWLRPFRWGVGPGFDFQIDDNNVIVLNYMHQVSEEVGQHNQNILELGSAHDLGELAANVRHELKFAVDVGLCGTFGTPNFGAKMQWGIHID